MAYTMRFLFLLLVLLPFFNCITASEMNIDKASKTYSRSHHYDYEYRLRMWARHLYRLQQHLNEREAYLDEREAYLRHNFCPEGRKEYSPKLCEYCAPGSKCANGLTCKDRRCQQLTKPDRITCTANDSCGPGQRRNCRKKQEDDVDEHGILNEKLVKSGFFLGTTGQIPGCSNGKVRIDCKKRREICDTEFCVTMTLQECKQEGLVDEDISGDEDKLCCAKVVPPDCFQKMVCRCGAKRY